MKSLLVITAVGEVVTGLAAIAYPPVVARLLFGADVVGVGVVLSRVAGAALLAIGGACWLARRETHGAALRGLLAGVLLYDLGVASVLIHAGLGAGMQGVILWPAVLAHVALAMWCALCLQGSAETTHRNP
jgi:hypothetical protein